MKRIFLVVAMMFSSGAFAAYGTCEIGNSGLPDAVVQKLKADCETLRLDQISKEALEKTTEKNAPMITPERITGWAQVAEGFANAMGAAAKQLNISVNEFIKTPAGLITIGVILWKVIGVSILKFLAMYAVFVVTKRILQVLWKVGSEPVERKFAWWTWTHDKPVYSTWNRADDNLCIASFFVLAGGCVAEILLLISLLL